MPDYIMAKIYDFLLFPLVYPIRRIILSIVAKYRYKRLLDVCCGTGNQLKYLCEGGYKNVGIGIDVSEPMLKIANKGQLAGHCLKGDAENLSFNDDNFDMTMISFALHEKKYETAVAVLKEMIRVTRKNGHIILVDFSIGPCVPRFARGIITGLEFMAGKEHFSCFKQYCKLNGLDSVVRDFSLDEVERHSAFFSAFTVRVFRKKDAPLTMHIPVHVQASAEAGAGA